MKKEKGIRFTFEQIVEIYDPQESYQLNGMIDVVQVTEGYAELDEDNNVECLIIDKCEIDTGKRKLINTDIMKDKNGYVKILNSVLR